ncbi:MAG: hypothetical protein WBV23_03625 [Desulfobaccales bacterium]
MVAVLAVSSANQAFSANPGETGTQVQTQGEKQGQTGQTPPVPKKDPDVIFYYALILALFIAIPTIIDVILAYRSRNKNWRILIEKASLNGLDKDEFQGLIKATSGGPPGIAGMSRSLMAFAVIIILGIAMFHLLTFCKDQESMKIISNVLSMLGATLASITGFYFGGRSAEEKGKEGKAPKPREPEEEEPKEPEGEEPKPA